MLLTKQRLQTIKDVEKLLLVWINEQQLAGDSVSEAIVCEKVRLLHADLAKKMPGMSAAVSRCWLDKFKKWTGIHSVVSQQESSIKVKVMLNVHLSISLVIYIYFSLFSVCKTIVILYQMYFLLVFLDVKQTYWFYIISYGKYCFSFRHFFEQINHENQGSTVVMLKHLEVLTWHKQQVIV